MTANKFVSIWRLLSEYTFKIDVDTIFENLLCIICNRIMVDACLGACGCHYCHKCINDYLISGDERYCPGGKVECNEDVLVMGRDVTRDRALNNKIYNLKVHCPNDLCMSRLQLSQMEEHLQLCTNQSIACPFIVMGCNEEMAPKAPILSHLHNESLTHTKLLIEWINNLKNEMEGLKDRTVDSKLEIDTLREQVRLKDDEVNVIKTEMEVVREEANSKDNRITTLESRWRKEESVRQVNSETTVSMLDETKNRDMRIVALERDWRSKDAVLRDVRMELEYVKEESEMKDERISELERDTLSNGEKVTEMTQQIINLKKENVSVREELRNVKAAVEMMGRQMTRSEAGKSRLNVLKLDGQKRMYRKKEARLAAEKRPKIKMEKLRAMVDMDMDVNAVIGGMTVTVERFSARKEGERIVSGHFYSHRGGYKWQLWLYPRQYGPMLSVCFMVCKGEFDQYVEWPCTRSVSVGLVNQLTGDLEHTVTYSHESMHPHCKYLFHRPAGRADNHPYEIRLVSHDTLRAGGGGGGGLLVNDAVIVKCLISQ